MYTHACKILYLQIHKSKIFQEDELFIERKIIQIVHRLQEYSLVTDILYNKHLTKFDHTISRIMEILNNYVCPRTIRVYLTADTTDLTTDDYRHLPTKISPEWNNVHYKVKKIDQLKINKWTELYSRILCSPSPSYNLDFWPTPTVCNFSILIFKRIDIYFNLIIDII